MGNCVSSQHRIVQNLRPSYVSKAEDKMASDNLSRDKEIQENIQKIKSESVN
jgi:hypothetical protein